MVVVGVGVCSGSGVAVDFAVGVVVIVMRKKDKKMKMGERGGERSSYTRYVILWDNSYGHYMILL